MLNIKNEPLSSGKFYKLWLSVTKPNVNPTGLPRSVKLAELPQNIRRDIYIGTILGDAL